MHQKLRSLALSLVFIFVTPTSAYAIDISVSGSVRYVQVNPTYRKVHL